MTVTTILLISLAFIVVNAIFVAAEFALIAAPKLSLERQATAGDRLATNVLSVIKSPVRQDQYVATAQLGITLASLGLGMFGEHALAGVFEAWLGDRLSIATRAATATALSLAILTVLHIVVGEMLPKGLALQNPIGVARFAYWPMRVTLLTLYPFVAGLNSVANFSLRLMGIRRKANAHEQLYTPEELQLIVEESEQGGTIRGESGKIVRELFEFGDLTASQVMIPRVRIVGIRVGASPDDLRHLVLQHRRTRYAVYDGDLDHIVGMLHAKDLLRRLIEDQPITVNGLRRIPVVPESAALDDVLATLQDSKAHMALVIDEHGGTAGILNLEDLFEEVVGDIEEGAPSAPDIAPSADGTVRVSGTLRLDELGQFFNLDLEHDEVESVSGLVLAELGRPPIVGDTVEYERIRVEVTATSGRGVKEARVALLPADREER